MILQRLADYYERLQAEGAVAESGFERKEIPFLIVLDREGKLISLRDTREGTGRNKTTRAFVVPKGEKKASGIKANLLWDTPNYVLGATNKDVSKAPIQRQAFRDRLQETFADLEDPGLKAVKAFQERLNPAELQADPLWAEAIESGGNLSFMLEGDDCLVCQRPAVVACIRERSSRKSGARQQCLVSGRLDVPATLHTAIKGVKDAQSTGGNIVSFNFDASESYSKKQGLNAPVGSHAEFAYTTALNTLLAKGSSQRMQVGDASTVFWAAKPHEFEQQFADLFAELPKNDGPDPRIAAVRSLLSAAQSGVYPPEDDQPFHILGLAPNAARISVRFWLEDSIKDFKQRICQHFEDIAIAHGPNEADYLSLFRLLVSTATEGKADNIQPNLGGDMMRAILSGTPYPRTLLNAVIRRIKAEQSKRGTDGRVLQNVTHARAALIKGILVRNARFNHSKSKEVSVSLDKDNSNVGYRLGRLFAVLERTQQAAQGDLNATIRDRFYGAASTTPVSVFPRLLKLKNHHLAKLDNKGQAVNLEREIGSILDGITSFPNHLSLDDQGRFAIGYYHQRQDFFTKHSKEEMNND